MSKERYRQFQAYTLPLAGVLMIVGSVALLIS